MQRLQNTWGGSIQFLVIHNYSCKILDRKKAEKAARTEMIFVRCKVRYKLGFILLGKASSSRPESTYAMPEDPLHRKPTYALISALKVEDHNDDDDGSAYYPLHSGKNG